MAKLLVANRGEIACRIFQAARELDIETLAVYTASDSFSKHAIIADQSVEIASYLSGESIIEAAKSFGATLIHPGYGFLSERLHFVQAVEKAGLSFVGPQSQTLSQIGSKLQAKAIAEKVGVPTLPFVRLDVNNQGVNLKGFDSKTIAKKLGFPLLIKAANGGGGRGMRKVEDPNQFESLLESAYQEAKSSFGDGSLFIERFLENPRHIEVQIFGDGSGKVGHLFERDCSLQRRNQKILEEAGAPELSEGTKNKLYDAAIKIAEAVQYTSAGTLEFLVIPGKQSKADEFYFLEMNTRLQVEHPVTESITGVDLVHAQLELALTGQSSIFQKAITKRGHSIEVRVCAEDPYQGFMPTAGKIEKLRLPHGPGIRCDSGIEEGDILRAEFDSLLMKLIVHAESRAICLKKLAYALDELVLLGIGTNQSFLRDLVDGESVQKGNLHIHLLDSLVQSKLEKDQKHGVDHVFQQDLDRVGQLFETTASWDVHGGVKSGLDLKKSPWFSQ